MNQMDITGKREIESSTYGKLTVYQEQIYHFPKGLVGLQEYKDYALVALEDAPFFLFHSLDDQISFILLPAEKVVRNYEFDINQENIELLKIEKPEEVVAFLIVNITENVVYVNLKAPLLLSPIKKTGCQFVIMNKEYPVRQQLLRKGTD